MACDPNTLLQSACDNGFAALSDRDLKVATLQLLCSGGGGGGGSIQMYSTLASDPNAALIVPDDPTKAAQFYQDPSVTPYNWWNWSKATQAWIQISAP
jgi:hypothetical protein